MYTIYRLFDLDYHVYVVRDNVLGLPVDQTAAVSNVMLDCFYPRWASGSFLLMRLFRCWSILDVVLWNGFVIYCLHAYPVVDRVMLCCIITCYAPCINTNT